MADSLYTPLTDFANLRLAAQKAARGKRGHGPAARFEFQLADELLALQTDLREFGYRPGGYASFYIHEPKRRLISAAPFRDRVVHHALMNIIEPLFERQFHPHSYANRKGKGTHAALDQFTAYARRYKYVLRLDIVQHFPSIDHVILRHELARVIPDPAVLWLCDQILASGRGILSEQYQMVYFPGDDLLAPLRPRGLPIGNLTSQFWSNVYLNPFDWFVTRELRCPAYLRYVDDFALFSDSKRQLWGWKQRIIDRLARLRLTIHPGPAQVTPTAHGSPWLGWQVFPDHRRLKPENVRKFRHKLARLQDDLNHGRIPIEKMHASVQGWVNHARYGDTWGLRRRLLGRLRLRLHRPTTPRRKLARRKPKRWRPSGRRRQGGWRPPAPPSQRTEPQSAEDRGTRTGTHTRKPKLKLWPPRIVGAER